MREIDGGLTHLRWTDTTLPIPHFTDTGGVCLQPASRLLKLPDPELEVSVPQSADPPLEEGQERCPGPESNEAEEEDWSSIPVRGNGEEKGLTVDGGVTEATGRSSNIWRNAERDNNVYPQKGLQHYCLAQEVPRTGEALRLHRNTLTMELVWLQQAVNSRKKYLSLKDRLSVS